MTKTRSLYSPAIPYKKPFEEKKLEKKDIERQVTFGVAANATVEKKKEKIYVFSGKSVEELIVCAERSKKVFGILRLPVGRWREEFANTLDTVLRIKFDQVETDGDDDGNAFANTQAGFTDIIKYYIRLFCPNPKARRTQKKAIGDGEFEFNPKGDIDVDDHALRIQSIIQSSNWLRGDEPLDNEEEKSLMFETFSVKWKDKFINGDLHKYEESSLQEIIAFMKYQSEKEKSIANSQTELKEKKRKDNPNQEGQSGGRNNRNNGRGRGRFGGRGRGYQGRGYQGNRYDPNYNNNNGGRSGRGGGRSGRGGRGGNRGGSNSYNNNYGGRGNGGYNNNNYNRGQNPFQQQQENHYQNNDNGRQGYNNQQNYNSQQSNNNNQQNGGNNQNYHNDNNRYGPPMW